MTLKKKKIKFPVTRFMRYNIKGEYEEMAWKSGTF